MVVKAPNTQTYRLRCQCAEPRSMDDGSAATAASATAALGARIVWLLPLMVMDDRPLRSPARATHADPRPATAAADPGWPGHGRRPRAPLRPAGAGESTSGSADVPSRPVGGMR